MSKIFFSNIENLCKKLSKNFKLKSFPDKKLTNLIKNYNSKDIIFISTTYILKHKFNIKNPILNFILYPKKYRGSALYFRCTIDKKIYEKSIMEPTTEIDAGRIIFHLERKIHNFSVFRIILTGYKLQNILINKIKK